MTDQRPITRADLQDLKEYIGERFDRQDNEIDALKKKLDDETTINVKQEMRLGQVEKRLDNRDKWLAALGLSAAGLILKTLWEFLTKGGA